MRRIACKEGKIYWSYKSRKISLLSILATSGVDQTGKCKGLWKGQYGKVIVYAYTKAGKRYTALSNAYRRERIKGSTVGVPVCSDYGKLFDPCDKFNKQLRGRIWPHRHGGKGRLGKRGYLARLHLV